MTHHGRETATAENTELTTTDNGGLYILDYTGPRPQGSRIALGQTQKGRARLVAAARAGVSVAAGGEH